MSEEVNPEERAHDPLSMAAEAAQNMTEAFALAQEAWAFYLQTHTDAANPDPYNIIPALADLQGSIARNPEMLIDASMDLWRRQATLWTNTIAQMSGADPAPMEDGIAYNPKQFADESWSSNIVFNFLKQSYLLNSDWIQKSVKTLDQDLPEDEQRKVEFFSERFTDALSPKNVFATNPEVLRATFAENGANIVRGLRNMLEDMKRGDGDVWISQTDLEAFEIGRNIAMTPGSVIFRNEIMELIQYAPTTETVHETPILIAPPWINKFYILDLNEKKSLVRWLTAQGHTVFLISWRNPEGRTGIEFSFEDYITKGLITASDVVREETGATGVNAVGYCVGGTMLVTALAYLAKIGEEDRINSATFFTAQADFEKAGELQIFADEKVIDSLEEEAERLGGVIGAQHMAQAFNMLRSNELIWNYVIHNYYLGKQPAAFDLLYWNADSTRMPARCHISYMRKYYGENALAKGELDMLGYRMDLSEVMTPVYSVSAIEDHIAPADSVYRGMKLLGSPVRFVLGGSGHIAGVVNPPAPDGGKYRYWTNEVRTDWPDSFEDWKTETTETPGSWWPDWDRWLSDRSGPQVEAREPGAVNGELEPAPGSYVKVRSDAH